MAPDRHSVVAPLQISAPEPVVSASVDDALTPAARGDDALSEPVCTAPEYPEVNIAVCDAGSPDTGAQWTPDMSFLEAALAPEVLGHDPERAHAPFVLGECDGSALLLEDPQEGDDDLAEFDSEWRPGAMDAAQKPPQTEPSGPALQPAAQPGFHAAAPGASNLDAPVRPLPRITIHASCDRESTACLIESAAADPLLARAEILIEMGGIEAARERFETHASPSLLLLDSTLRGASLVAALDELAAVLSPETKVVVIGEANDIGLFRALIDRGVTEYLTAPIQMENLVRLLCGLYGDPAAPFAGRTIAVIGARGGVGASTIAHNLAWLVSERQVTAATLLDLDLPFGTAAIDFGHDPECSIADALRELSGDPERAALRPAERLHVLTAPASLERAFELDASAYEALLQRVRATSPYVVLDLPHAWNSWIKSTLLAADDIIVVASPDLASLRNAKNIVDLVSAGRPAAAPPLVALSMVGTPRRPEISVADFTETLGRAPAALFPFDPFLCGVSSNHGRMISDLAPESRFAFELEKLAAAVTGRAPPSDRKFRANSATIPLDALEASLRLVAKAGRQSAEALAPVITGVAERLGQLRRRFPQVPFPEIQRPSPPTVGAEEPSVVQLQPPREREPYLAAARRAAQMQALPAALQEPVQQAPALRGSAKLALGAAAGLLAPVLLGAAWNLSRDGEADALTANPPAGSQDAQQQAYLNAGAQPGDGSAQYELALELGDEGRRAEAVDVLRRAAEAGHPMAQYTLAKLYERGDGVPANLRTARQWTERAAAAGNFRAMHDLGVYFATGEGAPLDEAAAFRWFRQAAEFGVADSQYNLGILYEQGRGVTADAGEALFWFMVAARQGDRDAAVRAFALEDGLPPNLIELARARARAFTPRAGSTAANTDGAPALGIGGAGRDAR